MTRAMWAFLQTAALVGTLGGCVAPLFAAGVSMGATALAKSGQQDRVSAINQQAYGDEMEEALALGKQRHPDVFAAMQVSDGAFQCLFNAEQMTYVAQASKVGHEKALQRAIDNAAVRSRGGECGQLDRALALVNPFDSGGPSGVVKGQ